MLPPLVSRHSGRLTRAICHSCSTGTLPTPFYFTATLLQVQANDPEVEEFKRKTGYDYVHRRFEISKERNTAGDRGSIRSVRLILMQRSVAAPQQRALVCCKACVSCIGMHTLPDCAKTLRFGSLILLVLTALHLRDISLNPFQGKQFKKKKQKLKERSGFGIPILKCVLAAI